MIGTGTSDHTKEASRIVQDLGGYFGIDSAHVDLRSNALMTRIKGQLDPDGVFV